ncbi:MAG: cupin domain-containing protein [Pseudomonadota bacterium]
MSTLAETAFRLAFGDLSFEDAIALREGDAWRFFPGHDPARFAHLLSTADLDAFLRTDSARSPRVSMADNRRQGSAGVPQDEFLLPDSTRVDLPNLFALFDGGASLVVSQFHELHPPLAAFCRGLEKAFLHASQSNIYLTPPGAQGFRAHYDTHDVLVLQVEGQKTWRVWDGTPVEKPTRATPWENRYRSNGEPHRVEMNPGDLLYIPRGVMHDASTADGHSLHITIGFLEPSWANVLAGVVEALERDLPELRGAVPTWRLGDPDGAEILAQRLAPALTALMGANLAERIAIAALDRVAQERLPLPARGLFPRPIEADTQLRLADSMLHHLIPTDDGGATLRWYGGALPLTAEELGWLQALEEGATAGSLGEGGVAFGRKLAALGLLER